MVKNTESWHAAVHGVAKSLTWLSNCTATCKITCSEFFTLLTEYFYHQKLERQAYIKARLLQFSSVQFSRSVVSNSLRPYEPQHTRPPCPSLTPGVHPNPCPLSQWCNPTISSSVIPFSSFPQSFLASRSFQMSQLFASGGQSIGISALASVLAMNTQDWSPLGWTGCISFQSKGLSRVFSNTTVHKHQLFSTQVSLESNSNIHTWPLEKA